MLCTTKLKQVLVESAVVVPCDDSGDELELREERGEGMSVYVVGGSSMVAIRMSTGSRRIGLLKKVRGRNLVCDYLLFGKVNSTWHAIFVELKTTESYDEHPNRQLRWSLPILEYLRQTCELVFEHDIPRPKVHYAILFKTGNDRLDKRSLRESSHRFIVQEWKGLKIRRFIGERVRFRDMIDGDQSIGLDDPKSQSD